MLYFRLTKKTGANYSLRNQSLIFLNTIKEPTYLGIISALVKSVERLPPHAQLPTFTDDLTINDHASQIYMTMSDLEHDDYLDFAPRANQLLGSPSLPEFPDTSPAPSPASSLTPSLHCIQGCQVPQIHQTKFSPRKGTPRNNHQDTPSRQPCGPRPQPNPTRHKRPFNPNITCDACKRRGHMATTCDQLAMALWIVKYFSNMANAPPLCHGRG